METQEREIRLTDSQRGETRQRIIAAASEEFAQRGYANARVRHIVDQAQVNVAAINYHFGGKEGLYRATLAHLTQQRAAPRPAVQRRGRTGRERLERRIFNLLERHLLKSEGAVLGRILAHEAMNPTRNLEDVIAETLRPEIDYLRSLLAEIAPGASQEAITHGAVGVLGQCLLYQFAQPALMRVFPSMPQGKELCRGVSVLVAGSAIAALSDGRAAAGDKR